MTPSTPLNPSLARELLVRADRAADQWGRRARERLDSVQLGRARQEDVANGKVIQFVIDEHGWPGHRLVGPDAARAAWRLALHADDLPLFQARAARLMRQAVDRGDAHAHHWAHLHDRALLNNGALQEFGTQYLLGPDGPHACPVLDPDGLDIRRAESGLPPAAAALAELRERLTASPHDTTTETITLTALDVA
ncbi:DUF6624 domain-containing protein [Streptomyces sp. NPDC005004]